MSHRPRTRHLAMITLVVMVAATAAVAYAAGRNGTDGQQSVAADANQRQVRPLQPDPGLLVPADPRAHLWPMNDSGLTYGAPTETVGGYHEPDLIRVTATNGKNGYSLSTDLAGPTPNSPEEAGRWQVEQGGKDRVIPVYESDGATKIGVFRIGGPGPSE